MDDVDIIAGGDMMRFMSRSRIESRQTTADRAFKPVPHQELLITQLRQDYATGHQRLGTGQRRRLHLTLPHTRHGLNTCLLIIHTTTAGLRLANHKLVRPAVMLRTYDRECPIFSENMENTLAAVTRLIS